jgi:pilus assembly protein Flp/PilA
MISSAGQHDAQPIVRKLLAGTVRRLRSSSCAGQGLVEYALILVLVAIVSIVIAALLGQQVQGVFCEIVYGLGSFGPSIPVCEAPQVSCVVGSATVANGVFMEAVVADNDGPAGIARVEFYIDGAATPNRTEYIFQYCLGGTDDCSAGQPMSAGGHTVRAVAYDVDGYSAECTVNITVN